ncbi:DUF4139 domain-containing protein [Psychrobacter frigidicola]|uniref:DUF4139 domain-containing protein n=1 Tax=Psychrobacter frigidicola TaxID=45611 RepID=A0A5C6ZYR0_9GAMM|nr:DUF4139 domain-containing protein [Psychrobacter frigidicola]TXD96167.1 DUF4139 domain-containing protein [Psychrobacter frigidicola]
MQKSLLKLSVLTDQQSASEFKGRWLKKTATPLAIVSITAISLPLVLITTAQAATSTIEQVTIYQGLASVTRALPISGTGEQTLIFSCLSPFIDNDSLSVQALGNVNVGEISIETLSGEQAAQCQYQGDAKVQTQQQTLADITAELEAAKLAKAYLQNLTKVTQVSMNGSVASTTRDMESEAKTINKKILAIQQQQTFAQDALTQLLAGSTTSTRNSVTQVSVRTASRAPSSVKLHYQVRGAGWEPTYQARLNTESEQLNIVASAIIAQQTGENWINVPLTLSTINPNQNTTSQLPTVPRLSLYEESQDKLVRYTQPMMERNATPVVVVSEEKSYAGSAAMDSNMAPLPNFTVSSQNKNGLIEYRLPQRVSIPSDGRRVRTVIDEQSGKSKLWVRSTPHQEAAAYWYASAPFLTPAWVDGSLQLYRDDNYVGQSRYSYQTLKEQGIGFGIDPNIIVKQLADEDKQGDKGVFNRLQTRTINQAYQFTNQHNRSMRLQVLSAEPVSTDESIKVITTHTPPISEQDWNDNKGIVAWEVILPSKQSQVFNSTYQISYPVNKQLNTN